MHQSFCFGFFFPCRWRCTGLLYMHVGLYLFTDEVFLWVTGTPMMDTVEYIYIRMHYRYVSTCKSRVIRCEFREDTIEIMTNCLFISAPGFDLYLHLNSSAPSCWHPGSCPCLSVKRGLLDVSRHFEVVCLHDDCVRCKSYPFTHAYVHCCRYLHLIPCMKNHQDQGILLKASRAMTLTALTRHKATWFYTKYKENWFKKFCRSGQLFVAKILNWSIARILHMVVRLLQIKIGE